MNTEATIAEFISALNAKFAGEWVFDTETGRKYVKVIKWPAEGDDSSIYCFVRLSDGAILKPASWKSPATGVRAWLDLVLANALDGVDAHDSWLQRQY